jgi:urea transport system ATP-binding protein
MASILETLGLLEKAHHQAGLLSHGELQWLEIGMVMAQDPALFLLDEPVAGMTGREREKTAQLLQHMAQDHAVLVVEHDMEFVRQTAQKVTVLHEGAVLCEGSVDRVQQDPRVIEVYLGRGYHADAQDSGT